MLIPKNTEHFSVEAILSWRRLNWLAGVQTLFFVFGIFEKNTHFIASDDFIQETLFFIPAIIQRTIVMFDHHPCLKVVTIRCPQTVLVHGHVLRFSHQNQHETLVLVILFTESMIHVSF